MSFNAGIVALREQLAEAKRQLGRPLVIERGPWTASADGRVLESDDFHHDATLRVGGDFANDEQRHQYAEELARRLNLPPNGGGNGRAD